MRPCCAVLVVGSILVLGGHREYDHYGTEVDCVWRFDPNPLEESWTELNYVPTMHEHFAACLLRHPHHVLTRANAKQVLDVKKWEEWRKEEEGNKDMQKERRAPRRKWSSLA